MRRAGAQDEGAVCMRVGSRTWLWSGVEGKRPAGGGEGGRWARTSVGSRAPSVGCGETESEGLVGERRVEAVSLTTP